MDEIVTKFVGKITSYNLFNNLLPGVVFCYAIEKITRLSISDDNILKNLFVYYFVGMIIGRIGSLIVEKILKKIIVRKKSSDFNKPFIDMRSYDEYIESSEKQSFIKELNETNNVYRACIALFVSILVVKLYDWLFYDYIMQCGQTTQNIIIVILCIFMIILFIRSYKKQTTYITERINKFYNNKEKE